MARRGTSLPARAGVRNITSSGIAQNDTATVADETRDWAHRRTTDGSAIRVKERRSTMPSARPRGHFSRFHKITGSHSSAANRKRTAAPRKGGTYSPRVCAAAHVVPHTMPRAAKSQPVLRSRIHPVHRKRKGLRANATPRLLKLSARLLRSAASAPTTGATARTPATAAMPPAPLPSGTTWTTA